MKARFWISVVAVAFSCGLVRAQIPAGAAERTLTFANILAAPQQDGLAYVIAGLTNIREVPIDRNAGTMTVRGTVEQIDLAAWIFQTLDQPSGAQTGMVDFRVRGGSDDYGFVVYLAPSAAPQSVQDIAIAIRTIGDIEAVLAFPPRSAIVLRGTAAQGKLAAYLAGELDQPPAAGQNTRNEHWYAVPRGADQLVRVFYLPGTATPEQLHETAARIRSAGITRAVIAATARAIALRGTPEQVAAAERIIIAAQTAPVR